MFAGCDLSLLPPEKLKEARYWELTNGQIKSKLSEFNLKYKSKDTKEILLCSLEYYLKIENKIRRYLGEYVNWDHCTKDRIHKLLQFLIPNFNTPKSTTKSELIDLVMSREDLIKNSWNQIYHLEAWRDQNIKFKMLDSEIVRIRHQELWSSLEQIFPLIRIGDRIKSVDALRCMQIDNKAIYFDLISLHFGNARLDIFKESSQRIYQAIESTVSEYILVELDLYDFIERVKIREKAQMKTYLIPELANLVESYI